MPHGLIMEELVDHVKKVGVAGLLEEYRQIRLITPTSTADAF